jgi:hypothetical protein
MNRASGKRLRRKRLLVAVVAAWMAVAVLVSVNTGSGRLAVQEPQAESPSDGPAGAAVTAPTEPPALVGPGDQEEHDAPDLPSAAGQAAAAGNPEAVARQFALAWVNRPTDPAQLRSQNQRLIALSQGFLADQIGATLTAKEGSGSRGSVVDLQVIRRAARSEAVLVITREQLAPGGKAAEPYHYGLYLARLERVDRGFAISDWEPQF